MTVRELIGCRVGGRTGAKKSIWKNGLTRGLMDRYSRADDAERLVLWLQHRDLRSEFSNLEFTRKKSGEGIE